MNPAQSKRLNIGQRVVWHDSADDQGTVNANDYVRIEWDNDKNQSFHHTNMDVEKCSRGNKRNILKPLMRFVLCDVRDHIVL